MCMREAFILQNFFFFFFCICCLNLHSCVPLSRKKPTQLIIEIWGAFLLMPFKKIIIISFDILPLCEFFVFFLFFFCVFLVFPFPPLRFSFFFFLFFFLCEKVRLIITM